MWLTAVRLARFKPIASLVACADAGRLRERRRARLPLRRERASGDGRAGQRRALDHAMPVANPNARARARALTHTRNYTQRGGG
eukprot:6190076-Pleurochrysis_carterae.AAC.1